MKKNTAIRKKHRRQIQKNNRLYRKYKRAVDIVLSGTALGMLSPVLLGISLAIKLDSKGPVIFRQTRVGIHKSHFEIYKFRTMYADTPKDMPTHLLQNPDAMVTRTGAFLRKYSLDELPQLWNILRGDMSIVGPRPALWNQYDLVAERDKYGANDVMPGLTGWAQINGRDELEIPVKAKLDGEYALDILYREVPAGLLQTQLDTCWVNVGGENPADYVHKYQGRMPTLHLKDFVGSKSEHMYDLIGIDEGDVKKEDNAFELRPVGYGKQDFPAILEAAESCGVSWVIVEQDEPSMGKSPLECAKLSIDYLKTL